MSPHLGFSFRVFCVFRGSPKAPRNAEDGWDSHPYLRLAKWAGFLNGFTAGCA